MKIGQTGLWLLLLVAQPGLTAEPTEVFGFWSGGDSLLHIREVGGTLSAVVVALRDVHYQAEEEADHPLRKAGTMRRDDNNPDPALRDRTLLGLELLSGYEFDGRRWQGKIYDPESGNTYSSRMETDGARLKMRGYIGLPMLGRTQFFEPVTNCEETIQDMMAAMVEAPDTSASFCD